jgi:hypothetical protein
MNEEKTVHGMRLQLVDIEEADHPDPLAVFNVTVNGELWKGEERTFAEWVVLDSEGKGAATTQDRHLDICQDDALRELCKHVVEGTETHWTVAQEAFCEVVDALIKEHYAAE